MFDIRCTDIFGMILLWNTVESCAARIKIYTATVIELLHDATLYQYKLSPQMCTSTAHSLQLSTVVKYQNVTLNDL